MTIAEPTAAPPVRPIILSGGAGTRLWPVSRLGFPKQFLNDLGKGAGPRHIRQASLRKLIRHDRQRRQSCTQSIFPFVWETSGKDAPQP